jgi:hypothetical protein
VAVTGSCSTTQDSTQAALSLALPLRITNLKKDKTRLDIGAKVKLSACFERTQAAGRRYLNTEYSLDGFSLFNRSWMLLT